MATPVVEATNESSTNTAGTSHTVNLPASIAAGDLLIVTLDKGSTAATVNALAGWTELLDENSGNGLYIAYRLADGTEGATITLTTSANTRSAEITYRISGAADPAARAPEIAASTGTGTSATPDPPSLSPTGGSKTYLWIAVAGMAGEEADDDTWGNTPPTSYLPNPPLQKSCGTAGTNLGGLILGASRGNATATEDPGTFGVDVSAAWRSQTIAIHPAPVTASGSPSVTADRTGTIAADHTIDGIRTVTATATGTAAADHTIDGNPTATATLTGTAAADHAVAGTAAITAALVGTALLEVGLAGNLALTATAAGTTAADFAASGTEAITVTLTGVAAADHTVDGSLAVTATATGTAARDLPVDASLAITSSAEGTAATEAAAEGDLSITIGLNGDAELLGQVSIDGDLAATVVLIGDAELPGQVNVDGDLAITATVTGDGDAQAPAGIANVDGALAVVAALAAEMRSHTRPVPAQFVGAEPVGHALATVAASHLPGTVEPVSLPNSTPRVTQRSGVS